MYQGQEYFKPYQSIYVDQGLPERAALRRERYEENEAEYDILNRAMGALQTMKGDQYTVDRVKGAVESRLGNGTNFEHMRRAVKDSVTTLQSDVPLMNALKSRENFMKEQDVIQTYTAEGKQYHNFNLVPRTDSSGTVMRDPITNEIMYEDKRDSHVTENDGIYLTKVQDHLDPEVLALEFMKGIKSDKGMLTKLSSAVGLDEYTMNAFLETGAGVTRSKVAKIAKELLPMFANTDAGRQTIKVLTELQANNKDKLHTQDEALSVLEKYLRSAGESQIHWDRDFITKPASAFPQAAATSGANISTIQSNVKSMSNPTLTGVTIESGIFDDLFGKDGSMKSSLSAKDSSLWGKTKSLITDPYDLLMNPLKSTATSGREESRKRFNSELSKNGGDISKVSPQFLSINAMGYADYLLETHSDKRLPGQSDKAFLREISDAQDHANSYTVDIHKTSNDGSMGLAREIDRMSHLGTFAISGDHFSGVQSGGIDAIFNTISKQNNIKTRNMVREDFYEQLALAKNGNESSRIKVEGISFGGNVPGGYVMSYLFNSEIYHIEAGLGTENSAAKGVNELAKMIRTIDTKTKKSYGSEGDYIQVQYLRSPVTGKMETVPVYFDRTGRPLGSGMDVYRMVERSTKEAMIQSGNPGMQYFIQSGTGSPTMIN
jgi:hypothetical protein